MLRKTVDKLRLLKHFFSSVRRRGMGRTLRISLYELRFERKFGSATATVIPVERLDYDDEARQHAEPYFPSSYLFLYEALAAGPVDCSGRVLVDYGCGMGRVLLFASTLPFRRLVGVELSPSLCRAARHNMDHYYSAENKNAPEWAIINADARVFHPPDDATVFYIFNSFDATIVACVLDNILISLRTVPRKCYLVYAYPIHESLLAEKGFEKIARPTTDYVIYTNRD